MKNRTNFLSSNESYLLGGLATIIGIALLPLVLGVPLSFEFAIAYWLIVIVLAVTFATLILLRQGREIKKSENQIRMYEEVAKNMKKKTEQALN